MVTPLRQGMRPDCHIAEQVSFHDNQDQHGGMTFHQARSQVALSDADARPYSHIAG